MATISTVKRVFKVGSLELKDPLPGAPLHDATKALMNNYPQFRWATMLESDGVLVNDTLEFTLQLPPPKVNG